MYILLLMDVINWHRCRKGQAILSSLARLTLARFDKLETLPRGLHGLIHLHQLKIEECPNSESLLERIINFSSLKHLQIRHCSKLASLPQGMHGLISLSYLDILGWSNLESLPEGIDNLSSLECLYLIRYDRLASLPQGLHGLTSLRTLFIDECPTSIFYS